MVARAIFALAGACSLCVQGAVAVGANVHQSVASKPALTVYPPYEIQGPDGEVQVRLRAYGTYDEFPRSFDLVGQLFDSKSGMLNAMSIQVPTLTNEGLRFRTVTDKNRQRYATKTGIAGARASISDNVLRLAYFAGDPPSGEKCRAMVNSWPLSHGKPYIWDMSIAFGDGADASWPAFPNGTHPTLIWQLKAEPGRPSFSIIADTDPSDANRVELTFRLRQADTPRTEVLGRVSGLRRAVFNDILVHGRLDDGAGSSESEGYWIAWVNGEKVVDFHGQSVRKMSAAHRWAFGVYMYGEKDAAPYSRVTYWRRARMLEGSEEGSYE